MKIFISASALMPSLYRKYVKGWDKKRYADLFKSYTGDRNSYRIYLPVNSVTKKSPVAVHVPEHISSAVSNRGYIIDDYVNGYAVDSTGRRRVKIGKLLPPELQADFANDKNRQGAKNAAQGGFCVISRHPYDVAGMSTGRGWYSCMNVITGSNKEYVERDVNEGSIIAYLVDKNDKNITNPKARILMRVYVAENGKRGLFPVGTYGTGTEDFTAVVYEWCSSVNAKYFGIPYGMSMSLLDRLYDDGGSDTEINSRYDPAKAGEDLAKLIINEHGDSYSELRRFLARYKSSNFGLIAKHITTPEGLGELLDLTLQAIDLNHNATPFIKSILNQAKALGFNKIEYTDTRNCAMQGRMLHSSAYYLGNAGLSKADMQKLLLNKQGAFLQALALQPNTDFLACYADFGFTEAQIVQELSVRNDWQTVPLPEKLVNPYKKFMKGKHDINELSLQTLPMISKPKFLSELNSNIKFFVSNTPGSVLVSNVNSLFRVAYSDKLVRDCEPSDWKKVWRGTSVLPVLGFKFSPDIRKDLTNSFSVAVAQELSKYIKVDAKRNYMFTKHVIDSNVLRSNTIYANRDFLASFDPKLYTTAMFQALTSELSSAIRYHSNIERELEPLFVSNPKLRILCTQTYSITPESEKTLLTTIAEEPNFVRACIREADASRAFKMNQLRRLLSSYFDFEDDDVAAHKETKAYFKQIGLSDRTALILKQLFKAIV